MEQFYDPPQTHSRKIIANLFQNKTENSVPRFTNDEFVPFSRERDKLGRLISRQGNERSSKNHQSLPSNITLKKTNDSQHNKPDKLKLSSAALERMFKLNEVKEFKSYKHLDKIRILSTSSRQKIMTPLVGQYDIAAIADKIKYKKSSLIALKNTKSSPKPIKFQQLQPQAKLPRNFKGKKEGKVVIAKMDSIREQINYDLPQLQKYHEMRKLKMKHYDNFQQNHSKFKELARFSLVLANQIKKGLELD